jgi:hypothetical protein
MFYFIEIAIAIANWNLSSSKDTTSYTNHGTTTFY